MPSPERPRRRSEGPPPANPTPTSSPDLVEVGYVARSHGLNGEVVVVLTTDREERVAPGSRLFSDRGPLVVSSARGQRTGTRPGWIVRFDGLADRSAADALRGLVLRAEPIDDPDELWAHDLVGADVMLTGDPGDPGQRIGSCVALVANPAADLLELDSGALVPVVFVVDVLLPDAEGDAPVRVVIDPPEGLLDL